MFGQPDFGSTNSNKHKTANWQLQWNFCSGSLESRGCYLGIRMLSLFTEIVRLDYAPIMRRILPSLILPFLMCIAAQAAQQRPSADQVLAAAKSAAVEQHKDIFLVFGASWCAPCHQMEKFMEDGKIRPLLEKYFVITSLSIEEEHGKHPELNSPGGERLVADFGGQNADVPFIVILDDEGQLLVNSNRPVNGKPNGENVGYPALPVEIDWFMQMLKKTVPSMTAPDARTIENWLRKASA
jgi:thioredoxin-related protein